VLESGIVGIAAASVVASSSRFLSVFVSTSLGIGSHQQGIVVVQGLKLVTHQFIPLELRYHTHSVSWGVVRAVRNRLG
jgi:hypothetical protein